jgi:hypothetical protein
LGWSPGSIPTWRKAPSFPLDALASTLIISLRGAGGKNLFSFTVSWVASLGSFLEAGGFPIS